MGYFLRARAQLKKRGLLLSSRITLDQVVAAILDRVKGTPLESITTSVKPDQANSRLITMHPGGAGLLLEETDGHVRIEAKTSILGPGYHAFLVSALESAESSLGLRWEWHDEADYVRDHDFAGLQARMANLMKELAHAMRAQVGSDADVAGTQILMDLDFQVEPHGDEVLTPLGPITVDRFLSWQRLDEKGLRTEATFFLYSWWSEGFDPWFYRGLALYSMWNDIRWAYPIDPNEVGLAKRTLGWVDEAMELGIIGPEFFPTVLEEITDVILAEEGPLHFPKSEGIGYRRRTAELRLGRNWKLTVPASLGRRIEEKDGNTSLVLENHVLHIRVTLGSAPARDDLDPSEIDVDRGIIADKDGLLVVNVTATASRGGDRDALCLMTVTVRDDRFRGLVEQIINSLEFTEMDDPEEGD
jgi:hypothetical protein